MSSFVALYWSMVEIEHSPSIRRFPPPPTTSVVVVHRPFYHYPGAPSRRQARSSSPAGRSPRLDMQQSRRAQFVRRNGPGHGDGYYRHVNRQYGSDQPRLYAENGLHVRLDREDFTSDGDDCRRGRQYRLVHGQRVRP
jgi:hypothetical protein